MKPLRIALAVLILASLCTAGLCITGVRAQDTSFSAEPLSDALASAQQPANLIEKALAEISQVLAQEKNTSSKKLMQTILVIVVNYLLIFILVGIVNRRVENIKARHVFRKNIVYLFNFFALLLIIYVWVRNISSIAILLGFASAGTALALQEVLLSIAGWFLIIGRRPFEVGDRIELGGVKGDVIDIRLLQTSLLEIGNWVDADQSTGRVVNIPNSVVFKKENYNYSRGFDFIWNEIPVLVTFESDWKRGKEIMLAHAHKQAEGMEERVKKAIRVMANRYMIYYDKLTPIVYVNIKDSGIELTVRYLTEAKRRRATQDELCRAILEDFAKESTVNFAYPTYRIVKT